MKNNTLTIVLVTVIIILSAYIISKPKPTLAPVAPSETLQEGEDKNVSETTNAVKGTYTYTNHGFSIELPKGFAAKELETSGPQKAGLYKDYLLPAGAGSLRYINDMAYWEKYEKTRLTLEYTGTEKIGDNNFEKYFSNDSHGNYNYLLYKKGNIGYLFFATDLSKELLKTFTFVGWPQVEGNKEDLVSFSIKPGQEVTGKVKANGVIKGGYFFEGSVPISVLDENKKVVLPTYGVGDTDWMTSGPVSFYTDLDFTKLPKGNANIQIMEDDPRDASERGNDVVKKILIPIIIK